MTARLAAAFATSLAAMLALNGPASAASPQLEESWRRCIDGNPDTSIGGCTAVIQSKRETGANLAIAFYNRGIAFYHKSQFERANDRGIPDNDKSQLERATQDYDQAVRLKPDFAEAFVNRGIASYDKGQYDLAIQDYDRAIRLKPDLAEAFNNRSLAYYKKAQYDRATQDFDHTIRLKKNYGNALINRLVGPSEPQGRRHSDR